MKYSDVIRQMERDGHYCDAEDLRNSLEADNISDFDRVRNRRDSYGECDSCSVQQSAMKAYDRIKEREEDK